MFSVLGLYCGRYKATAMSNLAREITVKRLLIVLGAVILAGGLGLAFFSPAGNMQLPPSFFRDQLQSSGNHVNLLSGSIDSYYVGSQPGTHVVRTTSTMSTTLSIPGNLHNVSASEGGGKGGFIQFSSEVSIQGLEPVRIAGRIVSLAYSAGGYVAYQSTVRDSSYVVIRVPAAAYPDVLSQIQTMGNVTSLTSNSNDATVQYTDLNATLKSLVVEQTALLRLANQSTNIANTLAIEAQLQGVDAQINSVQSQILQTRTLIQYSTISVSVGRTAERTPLSLSLSATPKNGASPLSVTMNARVRGGVAPYFVAYNFGDGTSTQGEVVVHQFVGSGEYNVSVSATDENGTVSAASTIIHVTAQTNQFAFGDFFGTVSGLFIRVLEGIIEAAVVVIPLALVAAAVLYPLQRRARAKQVRQTQ